jgi:hypothetical protein
MSTQRWRLVGGFVALALVSCGIYGCSARQKNFLDFDCSGSSKLVVIPFSTNPYPAPNTGTLVCRGDTLRWQSDVPSVSFTIAFENTDCFDVQSYQSSGGITSPTVGIRNPGSGLFSTGIGECKYSIIDAGGHTHDPHVIIMK